jgi:hypothetical protein
MVHFEFGQDRLAQPHPLPSKIPRSIFWTRCSKSTLLTP